MTFRKCVTNAESEGIITPEQKAKALDIYDQLELQYTKTLGPDEAKTRAGKEAFNELKFIAQRKERNILKQRQTWQRIQKDMESYEGRPGQFGQDLIAGHSTLARFSNLENRYEAIRKMAYGRMDNIIGTFRRGIVGQVKNKAQERNMVLEIFGKDTGDVLAKSLAKAWKETADYLRLRANEAGMSISNRVDWGLPQIHNMIKVRKAGVDQWTEDILPHLDLEKMIDESTGLNFSPERLGLVLHEVYETIVTQGFNKIKDGASRAGHVSLANRRMDHRFLIFKDADRWMDYQIKYGDPDSFKVMINHIDNMSRDIAELEVLGPNPRATISAIHLNAKKKAMDIDKKSGSTNAVDKTTGDLAKMDSYYNMHTNSNNVMINGVLGNISAGIRHVLQSAQLGSAMLTAISDFNSQRIASRMVGIPQTRMLKQIAKRITPGKIKTQQAVRLGLGADNWINTALATARFFGDVTGPNITRTLSDITMRLSGLSPFTQAGRQAFGMEYLGFLADNVKLSFSKLPKALRETFLRKGINENDWNVIRTTKLDEDGFVDYKIIEQRTDLPPGRSQEVATKLMESIMEETESAVPSSSYRARVFLTGDTRAGSFIGDLTRSFAMYKNFPVTVNYVHLKKFADYKGARKIGFFADYFLGVAMMGGLSLLLKDISVGKDPRPIDSSAFWISAIMQGGGLGIFGDFLYSSHNRYDRSISGTLAGPVAGLVDDVNQLTVGNIAELIQGKDTHFGRELIRNVGRYFPGSSIWYLRLAFERAVLDRLQEQIDPGAKRYWRKKEKRNYNHFNNRYWWRPGKSVPSNPPNLGNVLRGS